MNSNQLAAFRILARPIAKTPQPWQLLRALSTTTKIKRTAICLAIFSGIISARAANLDTVGVTLLRAVEPALLGSGVNVAQPEASANTNGTAWQVNPFAVGQPTNLFTYFSEDGSASNFPNTLGIESGHADNVARNFYSPSLGAAPGVAHVDNYDASYFYDSKIKTGAFIQAKIVNQSFIFDHISSSEQQSIESDYDDYAAQNNVLFVSGAGNFGPPSAPATCYNGIGVAVVDGSSSVGPTTDNGRSKPDITAPGGATSFSTPFVAGAATILVQAGLRGDGGTGTTNAAVDIRTLKALLLNGAIKPTNWTHTTTAPLDTRFGAGILNVFNSYKQLAAGKYSFIESTSNSSGDAHFPTGNPNDVSSLVGWDFNSLTNDAIPPREQVNHYYFTVDDNANHHLTATLAWNRPFGQNTPNNLDLFLYSADSNLVESSVSTVDNVEHLFVPELPPGRYDLQVLKRTPGVLQSASETYALAFEIFTMPLQIARNGNQVEISWPIAPTGFRLQSTSDLSVPISWTNMANAPVITNDQNRVTIDASASAQFFRLVRP